ncbi:HlyD family efflux transporter periplasmic adaptor subunit [Roseiconus nitratireducens]|uniref:HlyD family efflux transporter periplasmic adaptor subunit n=1 Tax=Roseiconus nitratireducens TaxID=2605748 RepID=A0A5M6D4B9_9BACT|nr:HlyD family efflux transporter periplasmic adaptor subunit [Roseiconus nitratireducens]
MLVENCMVRYINKTKVPAESQGKLTELMVEEGMAIKAGDVIAVVDDKPARLALDVKKAEELEAKLNAQNDVNKRDAVNSERIAAAEAQTYKELHEKGATPYLEMKKKQLEAERAQLRIELADLNEDTALAVYMGKQAASKMAEYDIEMRTIRAEFDAFVEKRIAQLGEWVQPGSPIVELVQMDRIRVEGFIDAINYAGQVRKGSPVVVTVIVGGTRDNPVTKRFETTIDYVSTELDLKHRHRIWVSIPNEPVGDGWLIKPGMEASMRILPGDARPDGLF